MQPNNIEGLNPAGSRFDQNLNSQPKSQSDLEAQRYLRVEYGDTFSSVGSSTQQSNNGVVQGKILTGVSQGQLTTSKPVDPVKIIGDMISAGFKPTAYQISQAQNYVNGSPDTVKTWFAVLLMKMLRQLRKRRS